MLFESSARVVFTREKCDPPALLAMMLQHGPTGGTSFLAGLQAASALLAEPAPAVKADAGAGGSAGVAGDAKAEAKVEAKGDGKSGAPAPLRTIKRLPVIVFLTDGEDPAEGVVEFVEQVGSAWLPCDGHSDGVCVLVR